MPLCLLVYGWDAFSHRHLGKHTFYLFGEVKIAHTVNLNFTRIRFVVVVVVSGFVEGGRGLIFPIVYFLFAFFFFFSFSLSFSFASLFVCFLFLFLRYSSLLLVTLFLFCNSFLVLISLLFLVVPSLSSFPSRFVHYCSSVILIAIVIINSISGKIVAFLSYCCCCN